MSGMKQCDASHEADKNRRCRVVIVEDDIEIAHMLTEIFSGGGLEVSVAVSGQEMDRQLQSGGTDLIVLDAMLPGEDGFSICRRMRAAGRIPILMLTALSDDIDRILGLELGADDYVTKPFHPRELLARVKGLLRRASYGGPLDANPTVLTFAGWRLDLVRRQVTDPDGVDIAMTTAEFELLRAFCQHPGEVMTRKRLLALTHAGSAGPVQRSVDVHVSRLRQKIETNAAEPRLIKTVRLGGYVFTPDTIKS